MNHKTQLIVHRAGGYYAPENTLAAMEVGLSYPVDGIEIDVSFTKDHVPVVYHDNNLKRTTGVRKKLISMTYDQLKEFDNGSWYDKKFHKERIPTLREFLTQFNGRSMLYLEIKELDDNLVAIPDMLQEFGLVEQTILLSFHFDALTQIKAIYPNMTTMFLLGARWKKPLQYVLHPSIDSYGLSFRLAYKKQHLVSKLLDLDFPVNIWSCNKLHIAHTLIDLGITSITTDIPDVIAPLCNKSNLPR